MLIRREYLYCAMIVCVSVCGVVKATSSWEQTLKLLGVSDMPGEGACVFWVAEDLSGECQESRLIQLVVQKDQAGLIKSPLKTFQDWGSLGEAVALLAGPKTVLLEKQDLTWQDKDARIKLSMPDPNQALHEQYLEAAGAWSSSAREWNKLMGIKGILCPPVEGMRLELLYAYTSGYYVNYRIKQVFYMPDRHLLFVQTEQKQLGVGLDTMHGFMVLRVWPRETAKS